VEWGASYFFFYSFHRTIRSSTRPALSFSTTEGGWCDECLLCYEETSVKIMMAFRRKFNFSVERHRDVSKNCCSVGALTFF
jgi:hypothetical protein